MGIETPKFSSEPENESGEKSSSRRDFLKLAALGALGALATGKAEAQSEQNEDVELREWNKVVGRAWTEAVVAWNDGAITRQEKEKKFKDASILEAWSNVFNARAPQAINKTQERGLIEDTINITVRALAGKLVALESKAVSLRDNDLGPAKESFMISMRTTVRHRETKRAMEEMNTSLLDVCSAKTGGECQLEDLEKFQKYLFSKESSRIFLDMLSRQ